MNRCHHFDVPEDRHIRRHIRCLPLLFILDSRHFHMCLNRHFVFDFPHTQAHKYCSTPHIHLNIQYSHNYHLHFLFVLQDKFQYRYHLLLLRQQDIIYSCNYHLNLFLGLLHTNNNSRYHNYCCYLKQHYHLHQRDYLKRENCLEDCWQALLFLERFQRYNHQHTASEKYRLNFLRVIGAFLHKFGAPRLPLCFHLEE